MAKLSARGRTMVYEVSRDVFEDRLQRQTDLYNAETYPDGMWTNLNGEREPIPDTIRRSLTIWERTTRRLMSDGTVLERRDVRFRPDHYDPQGRHHSYGWKVKGQLKAGVTPEDWRAIYERPMASGAPSPWTVR